MQKKTFIFYSDWIDYTEEMTMEEKGLFLQTILLYQQGKDLGNIESIKFVRSRVKKQLDETNSQREIEKEKRKASGKLGGIASSSKRKQMVASATNSKQMVAPSSTTKQLQAVNVNVNVNDNVSVNDNDNDNDNIKTLLRKEEQSSGSPEINFLISELKKTADSLGIAYVHRDDRNFAHHILSAKQFGEFCEKIGQTRAEFAKNIMIASVKMKYRKGPRGGCKEIYQDYADVYNSCRKGQQEQESKKIVKF